MADVALVPMLLTEACLGQWAGRDEPAVGCSGWFVLEDRPANRVPSSCRRRCSSYGQRMDVVERVRRICLGFPEATERPSHGAPAFFVGRQFACVWADGHHENGFPHLWCAAPVGAQEELIATSERFFRPPYVGSRGWIGVRLDGALDWGELAEVLEDAYRTVAPARLVQQL